MTTDHPTTTTPEVLDEDLVPAEGIGSDDYKDEPSLAFAFEAGTYTGVGPDQRSWRISPTLSGWRLEYRDSEDPTWSYSGTHLSLRAAQLAAEQISATGL